MTVYKRAGQKMYTVYVTHSAGSVKRSTGTPSRNLALAMERMVADLAARRVWDLLDRVAVSTLAIGTLYDAYSKNALDALRAEMAAVDLEPHVTTYLMRLGAKVKPDTVLHYQFVLRQLVPKGAFYNVARFTSDALDAFLSSYPGAAGTRRKAHAALSGFANYLVTARVISANPLRGVKPAAAGPPRIRYEDVETLKKIADAQPSPYRELAYLLAGSGIEVSVALALKKRDVDHERKEIRAAGTKTYCRDRIVRVADWAWPRVPKLLWGMVPDAPLFPGINRWTASDKHREACKALGITDYQLRDHRHSYAVRAARAGTPAELIARQLGHANAVLVLKVYGRFMPSAQERDKWERIASAQDQQHSATQQA